MRNTVFCFLGAVLIVLSLSNEAHSQSERWLYLGETENVKIYVDTETIYYNEVLNAHKVYTRTQHSDNSYQIHLQYYFCNSRTMKSLSFYSYNESGTLFDDTEYSISFEVDIIPESNPEKVFNYLCK